MQRIKLTKEKLTEIMQNNDNEECMEVYYNAALNDQFEADQHLALVGLLFMLVRYYHIKLFVRRTVNITDFFNLAKMDTQGEYWKFYELLKRTNWEMAMCLLNNEKLADKPMVEFSEVQAYTYFCFGNYFKCLDVCHNALVRDDKSSICNFIKASILELCFINKTSPEYKIALLNYQKSLIDQCDSSKIGFDIRIYEGVFDEINSYFSFLGENERKLKFTSISESFEKTKELTPAWTEEHDFYLRNKLFLNPLNNFEKFVEASVEEFEDLPIEPDLRDMFFAIVDDYKMCRSIAFSYYGGKNYVGKREMAMTYSYTYSIFDKVAFLLMKVYKLKISEDRSAFTENGLFDVKIGDTEIQFKDLKNNNIIPLYLIMKEVREKQKIKDAIQMGTFQHNELRNTIDHKSLTLVTDEWLKSNTILLMRFARDIILHTFMLLHGYSEENKNNDVFAGISTAFLKSILKDENKKDF